MVVSAAPSVMASGVTNAAAASKVAVVAQAGGDYTSPVAAMSDLATWCGTPAAANPCLLKIAPGVYDIASAQLLIQSYVDVEGSGENVTRIRGNSTDSVVKGFYTHDSEMRFLTIESYGSAPAYWTINTSPNGPSLSHVSVVSSSYGVLISFGSGYGAATTLKDVNVTTAANAAVYCQGGGQLTVRDANVNAASTSAIGVFADLGDGNVPCTASLSNVTISSTASVVSASGPIDIRNSNLSGVVSGFHNASTIVNSNIGGEVQLSSTGKFDNNQLSGLLTKLSGGSFICRANYDANFASVSCPH
jgi:hypothetical protein